MSQPRRILTGLLIGTVLGLIAHAFFRDAAWVTFTVDNLARPAGQLFLRVIFMIVVPLIFSVLVLGVFELGDVRHLGRVGLKTLIYTLFASGISVIVGLLLVGWLRPGDSMAGSDAAKLALEGQNAAKLIEQADAAPSFGEILINLIPKNPLAAAVNALEGEMISLMVFALIFGVALTLVRGGRSDDPLVKLLETVRDTSMKVVDFAMWLAPFGVAGLMFSMTAQFGWGLLSSLAQYIGVVLLGLLFQQLVVYSAILKFYARRSPVQFLKDIREVVITAFSTASSNATLPTTIRVTQDVLKVDPKIAGFVLTIGSTANQNGTALFEGVTILFLAQVFAIDLSLAQQVTVLLMSIVAGIGTAGVPGGSIPLIIIVMQSVGIPAEGIGIILGVDRLLDMSRTVLNVTGDIVAACVVDHSES